MVQLSVVACRWPKFHMYRRAARTGAQYGIINGHLWHKLCWQGKLQHNNEYCRLIVNITILWKVGVYLWKSCSQTGEEFYFEENHHLGKSPFNFTQFKFARYCHDATWALAWSLHRTMEGGCKSMQWFLTVDVKIKTEEGLDLSAVDYQNATLTTIMLQHMNNSFIGLSVCYTGWTTPQIVYTNY